MSPAASATEFSYGDRLSSWLARLPSGLPLLRIYLRSLGPTACQLRLQPRHCRDCALPFLHALLILLILHLLALVTHLARRPARFIFVLPLPLCLPLAISSSRRATIRVLAPRSSCSRRTTRNPRRSRLIGSCFDKGALEGSSAGYNARVEHSPSS